MINPRFLIQLPLMLLGSCQPLTPNTTIFVYTGSTRAPEVRTSDNPPNIPTLAQKPKQTTAKECKKLEVAAMRAYQQPAGPDLSKVNPTDDHAVVDAVLDNNALLRAELTRLQEQFLCTLE